MSAAAGIVVIEIATPTSAAELRERHREHPGRPRADRDDQRVPVRRRDRRARACCPRDRTRRARRRSSTGAQRQPGTRRRSRGPNPTTVATTPRARDVAPPRARRRPRTPRSARSRATRPSHRRSIGALSSRIADGGDHARRARTGRRVPSRAGRRCAIVRDATFSQTTASAGAPAGEALGLARPGRDASRRRGRRRSIPQLGDAELAQVPDDTTLASSPATSHATTSPAGSIAAPRWTTMRRDVSECAAAARSPRSATVGGHDDAQVDHRAGMRTMRRVRCLRPFPPDDPGALQTQLAGRSERPSGRVLPLRTHVPPASHTFAQRRRSATRDLALALLTLDAVRLPDRLFAPAAEPEACSAEARTRRAHPAGGGSDAALRADRRMPARRCRGPRRSARPPAHSAPRRRAPDFRPPLVAAPPRPRAAPPGRPGEHAASLTRGPGA